MKSSAMKSAIYFAFLLGLSGCSYESVQNAQGTAAGKTTPTVQMARKIKISEIQQELNRLRNHQTEYDFIGITSNAVDCIYFVLDGGKFDLEFEAMLSEQVPYIEKLRKWAETNHLESTMTTYDNKPNYPSDRPAPVVHIETDASIETAAKLGSQIEKEIFGNSDAKIYEVVP